jgi:hypothetical protein
MPKFIRLTKVSSDRNIAINVDHIVSFQTRETLRAPDQKGSLVLLVNDRIEVVETFDQIEELLK